MPEVTFDLPSGGSVTLRDGKAVRSGEKRKITYQLVDSNYGDGGQWTLARDIVASLLVSAWTLPYLPGAKIPTEDPATFDQLESEDFEAIIGHPNAVEALLTLFGTRKVTPDDAGTPGSPTEPVDA